MAGIKLPSFRLIVGTWIETDIIHNEHLIWLVRLQNEKAWLAFDPRYAEFIYYRRFIALDLKEPKPIWDVVGMPPFIVEDGFYRKIRSSEVVGVGRGNPRPRFEKSSYTPIYSPEILML